MANLLLHKKEYLSFRLGPFQEIDFECPTVNIDCITSRILFSVRSIFRIRHQTDEGTFRLCRLCHNQKQPTTPFILTKCLFRFECPLYIFRISCHTVCVCASHRLDQLFQNPKEKKNTHNLKCLSHERFVLRGSTTTTTTANTN